MLTEHNVEYWKIKCICLESIWIRVLVESAPWSGWVFMSRFPYNIESELLELNVKINKEHFLTTVVQKLSQSDSEILKSNRTYQWNHLALATNLNLCQTEFLTLESADWDSGERGRESKIWGNDRIFTWKVILTYPELSDVFSCF